MTKKLSVTIITKNEEKSIARCLTSVSNIADEIILVDSGSTDKTCEIAREYGAKVYNRSFDNYSNQKNYAMDLATGDWILSVDADEEIPKELQSEIIKAITSTSINGYLIPRRNFILYGEIRYTRWSPDKHIWLWRNGLGRWSGDIHEEVHVDGEISSLIAAKKHYSYQTVFEFLNMMNSYTTKIAQEMAKKDIKFSFVAMIFSFKRSFVGRYILKLGFLDGWRGFILSYMMGIYRLTTWIKVWELAQNTK
jgi:glycosyltransferase involved in cell wall biosynthesis